MGNVKTQNNTKVELIKTHLLKLRTIKKHESNFQKKDGPKDKKLWIRRPDLN